MDYDNESMAEKTPFVQDNNVEKRKIDYKICLNIVEDRINSNKTPLFLAICLALSNAADAVEIMCVGFILTEMDNEITTSNKGTCSLYAI